MWDKEGNYYQEIVRLHFDNGSPVAGEVNVHKDRKGFVIEGRVEDDDGMVKIEVVQKRCR